LELVSELVPAAAVIGLLANPKNASTPSMIAGVQERADAKNILLDVLNASGDSEIDAALGSAAQRGIGALIVASDPFFASRREQLVALTAGRSLPAIYSLREFVANGGLISLRGKHHQHLPRTGGLRRKILKGQNPPICR
jgi:putative ABC transport system substrate-binding protein